VNRFLSHCHIQIHQALHLLRKISWHHDARTSFAFLRNVSITFNHISLMLSTMLGSSFDEIKSSIGSWSFGGSLSSILGTFYEENHLLFAWLHFQCAAMLLFKLLHCFRMPFVSHLQDEKRVIACCVMIHGCWFVYTNSEKKSVLYRKMYVWWQQGCKGIQNCIPGLQRAICSFSIHRVSAGMLVMVGEGGIAAWCSAVCEQWQGMYAWW